MPAVFYRRKLNLPLIFPAAVAYIYVKIFVIDGRGRVTMRLKGLVNVLARRRSGILLLGSFAAVLGTVERLMAPPVRRRQENAPVLARLPVVAARPSARSDFFSIKRTHSDLGFTYWVLQGHGVYASFELFDTWNEAVAAAHNRLTATRVPLSALV